MTSPDLDTSATVRQLRLLALLDAARRVGVSRLPLKPLHVIAYIADAMAPVWHLPIIDGQILKRIVPYYPALQADLDRLVGLGLVAVSDVAYESNGSRLGFDAKYEVNRELADPVLSLAGAFPRFSEEISYVHEVVFATSGLALEGLERLPQVDAAYSNPFVDVGGLIDLERDPGEGDNLSAAVARRFGDILEGEGGATTAEMLNLYVRQLYARLEVA